MIQIVLQDEIHSVAFLADGQHIVSGDEKGKARRWQVVDGKEVGTPLDAGSPIRNIAAPRDGKWIVAGTESGMVVVWDAKSGRKVKELAAHKKGVNAMDVSSDGTKVATGSDDRTADVWSLPDGKRLFSKTARRDFFTVKFSPDGCLVAICSRSYLDRSSPTFLGIYDGQNGDLLSNIEISARSIVWANDNKRLFAFSDDGHIHCVDVSSRKTLSKWLIHSGPGCISLSGGSTFVSASANSSVSFWDVSIHRQIGPTVHHPCSVRCMDISPSYGLVAAGKSTIVLWDLLPAVSTPCIIDRVNVIFGSAHPHLKDRIAKLFVQLADIQRTAKVEDGLEILRAHSHVIDAARSLLDLTRSVSETAKSDTMIMNWLFGLTNDFILTLEGSGDEASESKKPDEALAAYATALSLGPSSADALLTKWVNVALLHRSTAQALDGANEFKLPRTVVCRAICDGLERDGRAAEAVVLFRQMKNEFTQGTRIQYEERPQWELDFQQRCAKRLEKLADAAMDSGKYDDAEEHYSVILSLKLPDQVDTFVKRSNARATLKQWENALMDADEVIKLDPSSHLGYRQRHAALHGAGRHTEAVAVLETLLSKLQVSPDPRVRGIHARYLDARSIVRDMIGTTLSCMPPVLIDVTSGCLLNRTQQGEALAALPVFDELVFSITSEAEHPLILGKVKQLCRYVMFSHKWGHDEPLFQQVVHVTVFELEASNPGNLKLQTFCSLVRSLGFRWAWCDTCCIDKSNNVVLQESLVAMFSWYYQSSLTIIHLCDVSSEEEGPDGVRNSIWNTRVWTYQEYVAAEVVQFYTWDWKPYLGLTLPNHKQSSTIRREMEVSQVSAEAAILRPGLDRVREKLYLASMRKATLVEDIAYSLLGIFNASIPVIYGEGTRAVGRLLEYVLTGSGDVTILAWTGARNEYNSCLPLNLTVYNPLVPPHIPCIGTAELDQVVVELRSSLPDMSIATTLYNRLYGLPSATLASSRLRLPCIVFPITEFLRLSGPDTSTNLRTYRMTTAILGDVEVTTTNDLNTEDEHCLVHPWIRPLLDQEYTRGTTRLDKTTRALRLAARLRQAFGALLFEKVSRVEYKRVASDALVMAQVRDEVSLSDLLTELTDNIETIEVQ